MTPSAFHAPPRKTRLPIDVGPQRSQRVTGGPPATANLAQGHPGREPDEAAVGGPEQRTERVLRPGQRTRVPRVERMHPDAHATVGTSRGECHVTSVGRQRRPAGECCLRRRRDVERQWERRLQTSGGTTLNRKQHAEQHRQTDADPCCRAKQPLCREHWLAAASLLETL